MARTNGKTTTDDERQDIVRQARSDAMRAAASVLVGRDRVASSFGLSHYNSSTGAFARKLNTALGYDEAPTVETYRSWYERGGIAARIMEAYPRATWMGGCTLVEDEDPDTETEFEAAAGALIQEHALWARLKRADILAGQGRYSALMLGTGDALVDELTSAAGLFYLKPVPEDRAPISKWVKDPSDRRYGQPAEYKITIGSDVEGDQVSTNQEPTHWSRVIHVADGLLEDDVFGQPRLRPVLNYLFDLAKISGGGSEAAWLRMNPGFQMDFDPAEELTETDVTELTEQLDEYAHKLRRFITTRGVTMNPLSLSVTNFGPNTEAIIKLISATTGIPNRILTGSERGELASSQDRSNWNDRIAERRQEFAEPVVRQLIGRLAGAGILPEADYQIVWPDLEELDEFEKADVAGKHAAAKVLTPDEIRERVFGLEPLEVEDEPEPELELEELRFAFDLADNAADEPEWKSVHRVGDAHRDRLAGAIERHWSGLRIEGLTEALESADVDGAMTALSVALTEAEPALLAALEDRLLATLADGGEAALRASRARGSLVRRGMFRAAAVFSGEFDGANERAIRWAALRAAELLTEVSAEVREAVRQWIVAGLEDGIPPAKLARQVQRIVGLRSDQAQAVANLATRLRDANPGTLVKAGKVRIRVPKGGITAERLSSETEKYGIRLRRQRAVLISRTETMHAANEGQRELWRQAVDSGDLPQGRERKWISTPDDRVREEHDARNGVTVGIDEPWPWGTEPGEEINCRCAQGLVA